MGQKSFQNKPYCHFYQPSTVSFCLEAEDGCFIIWSGDAEKFLVRSSSLRLENSAQCVLKISWFKSLSWAPPHVIAFEAVEVSFWLTKYFFFRELMLQDTNLNVNFRNFPINVLVMVKGYRYFDKRAHW